MASTDSDDLIKQAEKYIIECSEHAAKVFKALNFKHQFWEGTELMMSPKLCEETYRSLIIDLMEKKMIVGQKYGLFAVVMPINTIQGMAFSLQLGVTFPGSKDATQGSVGLDSTNQEK